VGAKHGPFTCATRTFGATTPLFSAHGCRRLTGPLSIAANAEARTVVRRTCVSADTSDAGRVGANFIVNSSAILQFTTPAFRRPAYSPVVPIPRTCLWPPTGSEQHVFLLEIKSSDIFHLRMPLVGDTVDTIA
jgi:hypothetical protein